ncbi:hypothetical protein CBF23_012910 [Marinomonas agarivorans]|nr:hypothetical protein CBF23_012910 [Marinomonas agarivorans]
MKEKLFIALLSMLLVACGGGSDGEGNGNAGNNGEGNSSVSTLVFSTAHSPAVISDLTSTCIASGATVTLSGTIQYERVPFSSSLGLGLNYNNIQALPARGVIVEALTDTGCVADSTTTSSTGFYALAVEQNTNIKIRVKAKLSNSGTANWDFEVRDNTRSNGLYVVDGALVNVGMTNSIRNLTATSGWGGSSYTGIRASAPFAILDSVYEAVMKVVAVDTDVNMDDADIFWSENNSTARGDKTLGEITTSHYFNDELYILGQVNSDTDEFDTHVIIHEWGHYFEDNLSRSDSIGGLHSLGDLLDMRVALAEGFGNAFAGMVMDDPVYRDSFGVAQRRDFQINVEANSTTNPGWFSESSVQSILYDIYDANSDGTDAVNLGFAAIYESMTSANYIHQNSMTSIFSLIHELKSRNSGTTTEIDTLIASQTANNLLGIDPIMDQYGTGETHAGYNTGSLQDSLPVYSVIRNDGISVEVCSHKTAKEQNGLGVRQFLRLQASSTGDYAITATYSSGSISAGQSDPDFAVYLNGVLRKRARTSTAGEERLELHLTTDEYILEVYDYRNTDSMSSTGGSACFDIRLTAN